jgi:hypothetical protein
MIIWLFDAIQYIKQISFLDGFSAFHFAFAGNIIYMMVFAA